MKHFSHHLPHYLSLFGILAAGALAFVFFSYDRAFQMAVIIAVSVAYVIWGIVHHKIHNDLYFEVVLEYVLIAALGAIIILSLIFRA